jgi:hypothetical protein
VDVHCCLQCRHTGGTTRRMLCKSYRWTYAGPLDLRYFLNTLWIIPGCTRQPLNHWTRTTGRTDKCFLVLIHTSLFMFVGPLALLISNKFTCFYCFVINRSLHQIFTKGAKVDLKPSEEVDPCQVRSTALGAFEHSHGRTQGATVERRPSQPASHAHTLAGLGGYLRSTV